MLTPFVKKPERKRMYMTKRFDEVVQGNTQVCLKASVPLILSSKC